MEDIVPILIYVIIIAVGGILSASRSKAKRKSTGSKPFSPSPSEGRQEKRFDPFEELFRQFEQEPGQTPSFAPEPPAPTDEEYSTVQDKQSLEAPVIELHEEGIPAFEETEKSILSNDHMEMESDSITSSQIGDAISDNESNSESGELIFDDARKAIIYSEILKRQHF